MALPPDESRSKNEPVLPCVHCISGTCIYEHISPLLGEHLCIVNIVWVPWLFTIERFHCIFRMSHSRLWLMLPLFPLYVSVRYRQTTQMRGYNIENLINETRSFPAAGKPNMNALLLLNHLVYIECHIRTDVDRYHHKQQNITDKIMYSLIVADVFKKQNQLTFCSFQYYSYRIPYLC